MKFKHAVSLAAPLSAISLILQAVEPPANLDPSPRPNILLIMTDDQDTDSLPVMTYLTSYPEGSWTRFTNAFVTNSICAPSRASLLTGQYSIHHRVLTNNLSRKMDGTNTIAKWLDDAGYRTGLIGKYMNSPWGPRAGWDYFRLQQHERNIPRATDLAIEFMDSSEEPFFLFLAYKVPHMIATPPKPYSMAQPYVLPDRPNFNEADVRDKTPWIAKKPLLSPAFITKWRKERLNQQRELMLVDDSIERMIESLKANGKLENTLIIFTADHGFSFGSHRLMQKTCPYDECNGVPLFIRYPGLGHNRQETRLALNVDLTSTITEYAGASPGLPQDGRSLIPLITGTAEEWRDAVLIEDFSGVRYFGIRTLTWKYIEYVGGERELYNLADDPFEMQNLAGLPEYAAQQAILAEQLDALLD